jgi:hypothetical protein
LKRVLFVSRQFPHDIAKSVHGVYLRMRLFLDALAELAETIEMLFYVEAGIDASPASARRAEGDLRAAWGIRATVTLCPVMPPRDLASFRDHYLRPVGSVFAQSAYLGTSGAPQVAAFDTALGRAPETVFVHRLDGMCPVLLTRQNLPPTFLDLDDVEHVRWARQVRQPPVWALKYLYYLQLPALIAAERRAATRARKAFVCSEPDRRYLTTWLRCPHIVTIPNAVAIPEAQVMDHSSRTLLFLATYAYAPNIAAAEFLVSEVWPRVRKACPEARLIVAGNLPERIPSFSKHPPGVEFTGFVEHLEPLYRGVRIVCCPVLSGGGTRLKILEAGAYGKAIVSTRVGAEGLELRDGLEIVLRDGASAFARACVDLLSEPTRCAKLGAAARETIARRYNRTRIVAHIKNEISSDH